MEKVQTPKIYYKNTSVIFMVAASKRDNTTDEFETENNKGFQNVRKFLNIKC
jgi:hypothetical protein